MPIMKSFDELLTAGVKTIGEVHDNCKIKSIAEYHSQQSGKVSIKITFEYQGIEFPGYMGLSGKSLAITEQKIVRVLIAAVGEEKAKEIYGKCCADEDVNTDEELCIMLTQKTNAKLKNNVAVAFVDRVKDGDFWSVKWKIANTADAADAADKADKATTSTDEFIAAMNH